MAEAQETESGKKTPVIQVKNLYKIYRVGETKVYALNGVDFTMYKGEFCAIVGTSGSGKSTLLNMLAGLEKPTKGEIIISGKHIEKMREDQLVAFRRERVLQPFGNHECHRKYCPSSVFPGNWKKGTASAGAEISEAGGTFPCGGSHAQSDVGRTAAESGHCQGAGGKSQDYFCRRAHRKPGFENHHGGAEADAENCQGTAADAGHGYPR